MSNEKIANAISLSNHVKSSMLEFIKEVADIAAKSDEREKAHEAKLVEMNPDYAKERLHIGAAIQKEWIQVESKYLDLLHEQSMTVLKGTGAAFTQVIGLVGRLPIETIPTEWKRLDDVSLRVATLDVKISDALQKAEKRLEDITRMAQSTKDKVAAMHDSKPNGAGNGRITLEVHGQED
jgi:hypothetical protein